MGNLKEEEIQSIEKDLRKPKTHKGRRILEDRGPKLIEGPKSTLFIKGNKTSENVSEFMSDLFQLKKDHSTNFSRRHQIHPFEEVGQIEKYCQKNNNSLFVFGSHQKKRPDNVVFGRLYNNNLLDMVEFGIEKFKSVSAFSSVNQNLGIVAHSRPAIVFQGEQFDTLSSHMQLKSLMLDMFVENVSVETLDLQEGLNHTIVVSGTEDKIKINTYAVKLDSAVSKKNNLTEDDKPLKLIEVGPSCDLVIRREKWANPDIMKNALKRPKVVKKKENKNVSYDNLENKQGRVFVDKQNLHVLALHKRKKLKRGEKAMEQQQKQEIKIQEQQNQDVDI